jgi:hypothetical protein
MDIDDGQLASVLIVVVPLAVMGVGIVVSALRARRGSFSLQQLLLVITMAALVMGLVAYVVRK